MATKINLLPWRQELREQRKREFGGMLVLALVAAGGVWFGVHTHLNGEIAHQENRNEFLRDEISKLDKQILKIRDLEETKEQLLSRMQVIQELQQGRPQIVHIFEQIVRTIPDGLYLTKMEESGDSLSLEGVAESNGRISNYMESLDASAWLSDPGLQIIEVEEQGSSRVSRFSMSVKQTTPEDDDSDKEGAS
ncbi:PilN domain-containing protein [Ectothiorhodospiraceae bacterium WFHF3C12]|nr:PilN domain-containing protein [Ectothiorhodospiraceae bacterium WFHF3C12]